MLIVRKTRVATVIKVFKIKHFVHGWDFSVHVIERLMLILIS
jgi:hypothetical protein